MSTTEVWNRFLDVMKENISSLSYETWLRDTKLVDLNNGIATVIVPMPVHKKHLIDNYQDIMIDRFSRVIGDNYTFNFLIEEEWNERKPEEEISIIKEKDTEVKKNEVDFKHFNEANLNKDFTFSNFIVGSSNRFAFTASMAVAEKPGKAYNP